MDIQELRLTMLQAILAQGVPLNQALQDAEAAVSYVVSGPPAPPAEVPTTRGRARTEAVLDMWAEGAPAKLIASRSGMSKNAVFGVVNRARAKGDPRAAMRHHYDEDDRKRRREHMLRIRADKGAQRPEAAVALAEEAP
jgi:hypothetical protein